MAYAGEAALQNLHPAAPGGHKTAFPSCPLMLAKPPLSAPHPAQGKRAGGKRTNAAQNLEGHLKTEDPGDKRSSNRPIKHPRTSSNPRGHVAERQEVGHSVSAPRPSQSSAPTLNSNLSQGSQQRSWAANSPHDAALSATAGRGQGRGGDELIKSFLPPSLAQCLRLYLAGLSSPPLEKIHTQLEGPACMVDNLPQARRKVLGADGPTRVAPPKPEGAAHPLSFPAPCPARPGPG